MVKGVNEAEVNSRIYNEFLQRMGDRREKENEILRRRGNDKWRGPIVPHYEV